MVEKPTHYTIFITIHCHYAQSTHKNTTHSTIKATGEAIKVHSPVLCFQIGIWSWILSLVLVANMPHTHDCSHVDGDEDDGDGGGGSSSSEDDELLVVSCITHYYCLRPIFSAAAALTIYSLGCAHSLALFYLVSCFLCASDHESNVHCHKNTFNLFRQRPYACARHSRQPKIEFHSKTTTVHIFIPILSLAVCWMSTPKPLCVWQ